jgi:hypothetical protein
LFSCCEHIADRDAFDYAARRVIIGDKFGRQERFGDENLLARAVDGRPPWVGRAEQRYGRRAECRGDVTRAGVVGDHEPGLGENPL